MHGNKIYLSYSVRYKKQTSNFHVSFSSYGPSDTTADILPIDERNIYPQRSYVCMYVCMFRLMMTQFSSTYY